MHVSWHAPECLYVSSLFNICYVHVGRALLRHKVHVRKHFKVARLQSEFCAKDFFFELRIFLRKMLRNFPRNFWAFVLWVKKIPQKFPPNFPLNFPLKSLRKIKKNSPTSFCRSAGRKHLKGKMFRAALSQHEAGTKHLLRVANILVKMPRNYPEFSGVLLSGVIRANRFARFARIGWFARIGNSSDSCESAWRAIKIGVSIANDSRESIRANRVANRPCH